MQWYFRAFRRYATFSGRAYRQEFWLFLLWSLVVSLLLSIIDRKAGWMVVQEEQIEMGWLQLVYAVATLVPTLALSARRLHDIGRSGWWQLIGAIPFVGLIVMIIWFATPGTPGPNRYGPDPRIGDPLRDD